MTSSDMDEMDIDSECTLSPEVSFLDQGDTDVEHSGHVDQLNSISYDDDDDVKMLKTEEFSSPFPTRLDYAYLLKGSISDLILCPIDEASSNTKPCCHQCRFCPKIFLYIAALLRHEQTHRGRFLCVGRFSVRKHVVVTAPSSSDGEVSDWEESHKKFTNSTRLNRQAKQIHKRPKKYKKRTQVNEHDISDTRVVKHVNGYSPGVGEKCNICSDIFESEQILQSHYRTNHRDQLSGVMSCGGCDYKTKDVRNFVVHGRKHTGETPYVCAQCGVRYISRNTLGKHVKSVHEGVKPYDRKCPYCGMRFRHADTYELHQLTHSGVEHPYVCQECNMRCKCRQSLSHHRRFVHGQKYKYICPDCGKDYSNKASLNFHVIRRHRSDLSSACVDTKPVVEYTNTQSDDSFSHTLVGLLSPKCEPSDESSFQCIQCDASFKSIAELSVHETSHASVRPDTALTKSIEQYTTQVTPSLTQQTSESLLEHDFTPTVSRKCCICEEVFELETALHSHYKSLHCDKSNQILSCIRCEYKTKDVRSFAIHGRIHTGERPYGCAQCGEHYASQNTLGKHVKAAHQGVNNTNKKCSRYGEKFKRVKAFNPQRQTQEDERGRNVCQQCDKRFIYLKSLNVHIRKVHGNDLLKNKSTEICVGNKSRCNSNNPVKIEQTLSANQHTSSVHLAVAQQTIPITNIQRFTRECKTDYFSYTSEKCSMCQETFESVTVLHGHYRSKHYDTVNKLYSCVFCTFKSTESGKFADHGRVHTGEKPYACRKCDKRYARQREVKQHVRLVHYDGESYNRQCLQCGERFQQRELFELHRRTHKDERPYVCEQCDRGFSCPKYLKLHIRHVHEKLFRHRCVQCGEGCVNSSQLKMHMINRHGVECSFLCTVCGKKCPSRFMLRKHEISHSSVDTGGISYQCSQCDKKFLNISARARHIKTVHVGERPYECVECGKKFKHRNHMNTHVAIHSTERPFLCMVCGKMFASTTLLKVHVFSHSRRRKGRNACDIGEKRFACAHCEKKFYTNSARTRHTKTVHRGERPFVCVQCGKMFKQRAHLNTHMTSHLRQ